MTADSDNQVPGPKRTIDSAPFWSGAERGALVYGHCDACEHAFFYPRPFCPLCGSSQVTLKDASGHGTLYSFSTLRVVERPYTLAYVTLDEGPTVLTNIVDSPEDAMRIGTRVELTFVAAQDDTPVPMFRMTRVTGDSK